MAIPHAHPNILLIMADQLAAPALPIYGHPIVKTPAINKFAKSAAIFKNAYCNFPICAPSRYSMLTGMLPHKISAFDNASELPASMPTIAHYLTLAGYDTSLVGKMHFVGPDQLHGFEHRSVTDIYPADFAWVPDWNGGPRNAPTGISMRAVTEAGPCERSLQLDYDEEVDYFANQVIYDLARRSEEKPFFMVASYTHPHSPFTAPQEYWDLYQHEEIDLPKVKEIPFKDLDVHSQWLYYSHSRDRFNITEEHIRNARHAYYAMISYVDSKIGKILDTLKKMKLDENTVIIFTGDHGEMMGERGMWFKQTFFEWSSRVPLMISTPEMRKNHQQKIISEVVSLVDLFPTILDLAGEKSIALATTLDGESLAPLITGQAKGWKNIAISEYSDMGVCAPCRMVRKDQFKYIYTHEHPSQLFDLEVDPIEMVNLSGNTKFSSIEEELKRLVLKDWNPTELESKILQSQAARKVINSAAKKSKLYPNWSFESNRNDKKRYVRGSGDQEGTVAVKGKARFPFVAPTNPDYPPKEI
jgi:choline-sulfatase